MTDFKKMTVEQLRQQAVWLYREAEAILNTLNPADLDEEQLARYKQLSERIQKGLIRRGETCH